MFFEALNEWLIYGIQAIVNLFSQYFKNEGFSSVQIGILITVGRVMSLVANPLWFSFKTKFGDKKTISIITIAPLIFIWGIYLLPEFEGKFFTMAISGLFLTVLLPIIEGRVISSLMSKGIEFNPSRLVGSIGFSVIAFISGILMDYNNISLFILLSIMLVSVFVLNKTHTFEHKNSKETHKTDGEGTWKAFIIMLITGIIALVSAIFYITFLPIYLGQKGYPVSFTGISFFIFALSEIPFLLLSKKIIHKIGEPMLLATGILACGLRILFSASSTNFTQFVFISLLHGWGYIVIYYSIYHYIHYHMPERLINKAQALFWMGMTGIGYLFGSFLGGFIVENVGLIQSFSIIGVVVIIISLLLGVWNYYKHPLFHI